MNIKIFGTGCPNCQLLEQNAKEALKQLGEEATVEKVTEIHEIMSYGIMSTPALVVDGNVLIAGMVPSVADIKNRLTKL